MTRVSAGELNERERERGRARGRDGGGMRQGEIVQCQGYMGARAQNRPYAEERQGGSVEGRTGGGRGGGGGGKGRGREKEEQERRRTS